MGTPAPQKRNNTHYYATIDISKLASERYNKNFANYLTSKIRSTDFIIRLAKEKSIILTSGGDFDAPNISVRVSLASLPNKAYAKIGRGISEILKDYHQNWAAAKRPNTSIHQTKD